MADDLNDPTRDADFVVNLPDDVGPYRPIPVSEVTPESPEVFDPRYVHNRWRHWWVYPVISFGLLLIVLFIMRAMA